MRNTEKILKRYRHMMVDSGVEDASVTDEQLLIKVKGNYVDEQLDNIERILSMVPERYWETQGL